MLESTRFVSLGTTKGAAGRIQLASGIEDIEHPKPINEVV